jgi:hypothetical protein
MHRYGRHGPHAWLRMHKRLRTSLRPTVRLVPTVVQHPVSIEGIERIIFIVIEDYNEDNDNENQGYSFIEASKSQQQLAIPSELDKKAIQMAQRDASRYIDDLADTIQNQRIPIIHPEKIRLHAREKANEFIKIQVDDKDIILAKEEEKRVRKLYIDTFLATSQEEQAEHKESFPSESSIRLHDAALRDKKATPNRLQPEINTLAAISAVLETQIPLDTAHEYIEMIQPLVKVYMDHYQKINLNEEVPWNNQEFF